MYMLVTKSVLKFSFYCREQLSNCSCASLALVVSCPYICTVWTKQQVRKFARPRFVAKVYNEGPLVNSQLHQILTRNQEKDAVYTEEVKA